MTKEVWKDVEDYEGLYQVSNQSRLRSLDRDVFSFSAANSIQKRGGVLLSIYAKPNEYAGTLLCKEGVCKYHSIHRLMAKAFIPNVDKKPEVNHKDGLKHNNSLDNLEWVSCSQNIQHRFDVLGHKHPTSIAIRCITLSIEAESVNEMGRLLVAKNPKYKAARSALQFHIRKKEDKPFKYLDLLFEVIG